MLAGAHGAPIFGYNDTESKPVAIIRVGVTNGSWFGGCVIKSEGLWSVTVYPSTGSRRTRP